MGRPRNYQQIYLMFGRRLVRACATRVFLSDKSEPGYSCRFYGIENVVRIIPSTKLYCLHADCQVRPPAMSLFLHAFVVVVAKAISDEDVAHRGGPAEFNAFCLCFARSLFLGGRSIDE